ncbi:MULTISPECIES: molybdopterin-dependent oxidoreductase [unclassified Streptomyces]|uniref:molybdopterin-dependent oxidoreductase n=1 Tax=unclassified Streptomyces TaxID=2593676 RepID=UPI000DC7EEEA|nr:MULTISPECIES: molybdopterin-dependent oxidoreductase [unclassified Streptomyces]AWZ06817.1 molybdopterin-binding oxidoreductase [Streptomyces sp. ICC4]AWZ14428.1 molybdopterin-binding oxidoreductase [Streptomyces sp. ICC1]
MNSAKADPGRRRYALGAAGGLVAAAFGLALAHLAAAAVRPEASPVTAIGGAVVDRTPVGLKEWAVRQFGTGDKLVLALGILVVLGAVAALAGLLAVRRMPAGLVLAGAVGVLGAVAALSRPEASWKDALPSLVGGAAAAGMLYLLVRALKRPATGAGTGAGAGADGLDRRGFGRLVLGALALSAAAGYAGRRLGAFGSAGATASRTDLVLPAPSVPAPPVPAGADLRIPGASRFLTPNADFYRVDTALVVPRVDADAWRLRIHGEGVARPLALGLRELLARPLVEHDITLTCVSNEVGGPYAGNARWLGVRLADLLREAGVRPPSQGGPADQLVARSVDGMTLGTPVEAVMDGREALLAVGMNGEPLPFRHGFPVRMVVPGLYGYVSACKWLTELRLTTFSAYDAYWVRRSWAPRAPVKTQSRIDTPRPSAEPAPGRVAVAGVAWAQHRGIARVEVRVDAGVWQEARLGEADGDDTWRQWVWIWEAAPGPHILEVRATDRTGAVQTGERAGTVPDGATGWHSVAVRVRAR